MNKYRMESLKLMMALQPLTQSGIIKAQEAQSIVENYREGNISPLKELTLSPSLPVTMQAVAERLAEFI